MMGRARLASIVLSGALAGSLAFVSTRASAQSAPAASEKARAKEAYDRGVQAHKRGDFQAAARDFAEADSLAPSNIALQAALDASVDADDPALGGELIDRSRRTTPTGALAQSVEAARKKFTGRSARIGVTCPSGSTCRSTVDGAPMDPKRPTWVRAGSHTVVVVIDGDTQTKVVDARADQIEAVVASRPVPSSGGAAATPPATASSTPTPPATATSTSTSGTATTPTDDRTPAEKTASTKLPPTVFWVGVGVTGAAALVSAIFMATASSAHSDFVDAGCERANELGCAGFKEAGEGSQTRANVSLVVTGVLAVATVVIGAALTDWSGRRNTTKTGSLVWTGSGVRF